MYAGAVDSIWGESKNIIYEKFEHTKVAIRSRKWKDRHHSDLKKKNKKTNI